MRAFSFLAGSVGLFFLIGGFPAPQVHAQTITVTARVQPRRIIIVDKNLTILDIVSNTREHVVPMVVLEVAGGKKLPYAGSIQKQYELLQPSLDFSKPGTIYKQEDRLRETVYQKTQHAISKWVRLLLTSGA